MAFGRRVAQPAVAVREHHQALREAIGEAVEDLEMYRSHEPDLDRSSETPIHELRRRSFRPQYDRLGTMTLIDDDGILRWEATSRLSVLGGGARRGLTPRSGAVVDQLRFERLERSQVGDLLTRLDRKLNPSLHDAEAGKLRGLTRNQRLPNRAVKPAREGTILLIVHGTFSRSENLYKGLLHTEEGRIFLQRARKRYTQVLFFDHPTLQVSPVINAVDLERALRSSGASIDVICHSRGGLVTRWWAEALLNNPDRLRRVVFVGAPLAGTSLAAPPRLKHTLDYLTNIFDVLKNVTGLAAQVAPLMVVVTGLLKVLSLTTKVVAKTPLVDVGVAAVPGLVGQSRVGDNPEIRRLREGRVPLEKYYAVLSNFEPEESGWRFWRFFCSKPGQRLLDVGADLIFREENDLVVDTASMTDLVGDLRQDIPAARRKHFDPRSGVHHLNYFHQRETIEFLSESLREGAD